ncbi:Uncharacterised protein [uncultured archaeon]|nr:Uncharacterised protein [uncultured archaeon]
MGSHDENAKALRAIGSKVFKAANVKDCKSQGSTVICDVDFKVPDSDVTKHTVCTLPDDTFRFDCKEK